jgi:glycosyltransferase involved in cell wall biosynthesis
MKCKSLVSVIIPVYNGERYLAEAIESVLAQTYRPIEVIVVDDGSTDGSANIVRGFPSVRYCLNLHGGLGEARNRGIESAKGEFFAFLDSDDLWVGDKLARQMTMFDDNPELDMVFGHVRQLISSELDDVIKKKIHCPDELMPGYVAGCMLIRREAFLRVGLFETNWRLGEFIDWYLRAVERGLKSFILPEIVLNRRLHDTNMGIRDRNSQTDYVRILKASLDRRRKVRN